jgi:hypothetical protein
VAVVVDIFNATQYKKSLPFEGFFIDANIIIHAEDPFSKSSYDNREAELNSNSTFVLGRLKQLSFKVFSTYSVASEYYKYIQYNYYTAFLQKPKFDIRDFKKQRDENIDFMNGWDAQMKKFKRIFNSKYPIYSSIVYNNDLIQSFNFNSIDFGDHLIIKAAEQVDKKFRAIFSNDKDFYSIGDDYYLVTLDQSLIERAKKEGKFLK